MTSADFRYSNYNPRLTVGEKVFHDLQVPSCIVRPPISVANGLLLCVLLELTCSSMVECVAPVRVVVNSVDAYSCHALCENG